MDVDKSYIIDSGLNLGMKVKELIAIINIYMLKSK